MPIFSRCSLGNMSELNMFVYIFLKATCSTYLKRKKKLLEINLCQFRTFFEDRKIFRHLTRADACVLTATLWRLYYIIVIFRIMLTVCFMIIYTHTDATTMINQIIVKPNYVIVKIT